MLSFTQRRAALRVCQLIAVSALFGACGGGGGGGGGDTAPPPPPPPVSVQTVKGVAATGAAIAGGAVVAVCASGTAATTTASDGSYSLDVKSLTLPCVIRVTGTNGIVLHSVVASGSSATLVANLTPATELVVARLAGSSPASYFSTFNGAVATGLTTASVQSADAAVVSTLKNAGVDLSSVGSALTGTLVAASGTITGNAYDNALDTLKTTLASSGTSLTAFTASVAASSPAAPKVSSVTASLPPDLILNSSAPRCTYLRSGDYWAVINGVGRTRLNIDAPGLIAKFLDPSTGKLTGVQSLLTIIPGSANQCLYKGFAREVAFSPAGVGVTQMDDASGAFHGALIFPAQKQIPSELAGDWNFLGMDETPSATTPVALVSATATIDSNGKVTASNVCTGVSTGCKSNTVGQTITANATGSMDVKGTDGSFTEAFSYRSGSGELMLVLLTPKTFLIGVRKTTLAVPAVGSVERFQALQFQTAIASVSRIGDLISTVTAVDTSTARYTRSLVLDTSSGLSRNESLAINDPGAGFQRRPSTTVVASDGSSSTVQEIVTLDLPGAGLRVTDFVGGTVMQLAVSSFGQVK